MKIDVKDGVVKAIQQINENLVYTQHISFGYKFKGLQTNITGIKDGMFFIDVYMYAETLESALQLAEKGSIKNVNPELEMFQGSHSLWA